MASKDPPVPDYGLIGATIGSSLDLDVVGVNPDGVVDEEHYAVLINALDDTVQVVTLT